MRIYIAGPMTGYKDYNYPAFEEADQELREAGYEVYNPTSIMIPPTLFYAGGKPLHQYCLQKSIPMVCKADGVATLPDAACSEGSFVEITVARAIGIPIKPLSYWLEMHFGNVPQKEIPLDG